MIQFFNAKNFHHCLFGPSAWKFKKLNYGVGENSVGSPLLGGLCVPEFGVSFLFLNLVFSKIILV